MNLRRRCVNGRNDAIYKTLGQDVMHHDHDVSNKDAGLKDRLSKSKNDIVEVEN